MNENLDLVEILKGCKPGTIFYSPLFGEVIYRNISEKHIFPINVDYYNNDGEVFVASFCKDGRYLNVGNGECMLFPSKEQRDWSKFTAPWYKKERFDPKTLKAFDRVIVRLDQGLWCCELFSFIEENTNLIKGCGAYYKYCIPYNNDTKHLIGTTDEAPEYYRYWED